MKRRLFNVLAGVSLVLCMATAVFWVRSYWVCDGFISSSNGNASLGRLAWGKLNVLTIKSVDPSVPHVLQYIRWQYVNDGGGDSWLAPGAFAIEHGRADQWKLLGFVVDRGTQAFPQQDKAGGINFKHRPFTRTVVPYWPILVLAAWPIWIMIPRPVRYIVRRLSKGHDRVRAGQCLVCGYDLRATPNRCPECGTIPEKAT